LYFVVYVGILTNIVNGITKGTHHSYKLQNGNPNHKKSWQEAIATPALSLVEQLDHEIWQEQVKADFKAKWNNGLKQQFEDRS